MDFENHETFFDVWHRIPFVLFHTCLILCLSYFILVLFFLLFLFDDAVVTLLARLHGVRMC